MEESSQTRLGYGGTRTHSSASGGPSQRHLRDCQEPLLGVSFFATVA